MTNKSNTRKSSHIRTLKLEFEGNKGYVNNGCNGFRPHGGYRGTNNYPISQYSFNKEYKQQLRDDIDRLFESNSLESIPSPGYAIHKSKDITHSGDSPLFESKLLAPSRLEQKFSPEEYANKLSRSQPKKTKRPGSGVQYYRPESPHQYMPASRANGTENEDREDFKYGRPTRTTLLRARHRCNSAPVNVYKMRKEIQKQYEQTHENRRSTNASITVKDILGVTLPQGESIHSFLIGARYNSAHCLDSKSIVNHGVYMPRGNPLGCFVLKERYKEGSDGVPATPPDSPLSNSDNEDDGRPSTPVSKQAWSEDAKQEKRKIVKCTNIPIMQQIMNIDDGLNVKGAGVNDQKKIRTSRPNSARMIRSRPSSARAESMYISSSRTSARGVPKPFVLIQGKSLPRSTRSMDHGFIENKPPSPPPSLAIVGGGNNDDNSHKNGRHSRGSAPVVRPRSSKHRKKQEVVSVSVPTVIEGIHVDEESIDIKSEVVDAGKTSENVNDIKLGNDCENETYNKTSSVENEPPSELKTTTDDVTVSEKDEYEQTESHIQRNVNEENKEHHVTTENTAAFDTGNEQLIAATKRTSRVRFADEVEELKTPREADKSEEASKLGQGDNAAFFLTEESNNNKTLESNQGSPVEEQQNVNESTQNMNESTGNVNESTENVNESAAKVNESTENNVCETIGKTDIINDELTDNPEQINDEITDHKATSEKVIDEEM